MPSSKRPAISRTITKALYARSGNRCTLCQCIIVEMAKTEGDGFVNLGKIAHINAISNGGPRGVLGQSKKDLNNYDNLILVCPTCHEKIDQQEVVYSAQELKRIKKNHEKYHESLKVRMSQEQANVTIQRHNEEIRYAYHEAIKFFVSSEYKIGNESVYLSDERFDELLGRNLQIVGGSGRGKSLLAKVIAVKSINKEIVALIIEAIQFVNQIDKDIENWRGQFAITLGELEEACTILEKKITLIIDGYNECPPNLTTKLNLWILGLVNRHNARVIITTQHYVKGLDELNFLEIEVQVPSIEVKKEIARRNASMANLNRTEALLSAVKTGLEAKLIGEISMEVSSDASRYEIFDLYARHRLNQNSQRGISALSSVAKYLYERITFSLSIRDFDRLISTQQNFDYLFESGLLTRRASRVYFGHELFFNAFAAEAVVRDANGDSKKLIKALSLPKHNDQRVLILGAIDDYPLLDSVLAATQDFNVIEACLTGDCGGYPKQWAQQKCIELFSKVKIEIGNLSFKITDIAEKKPIPSAVKTTMFRVLIHENSAFPWTPQEIAFIHTLPLALINGNFIHEVFEIFQQTDEVLSREFKRLRPEAIEKRISIGSNMFQEVYLGIYSSINTATSMIAKNFNSGGWSMMELIPSPLLLEYVKKRIKANDLTNGQLYLLIEIVRLFRFRNQEWKTLLGPVLSVWIKESWKYFPYHLKNALLDAAHYSDGYSIEQREELIYALNNLLEIEKENFMMPTSIIEALHALGALENDELQYEDVVRNELANIFHNEDDPKNQYEAFSFHQRTFDHPYYGAYWQVLDELSEADAKKLYNMAVKGAASHEYVFGLPTALYKLAVFQDPLTADSFIPFCSLPSKQSNMPLEAIETFLAAHVILGWLGKSIVFGYDSLTDASSKALKSYAEILYWLNRRDLTSDIRFQSTENAWKVLLDHLTGASAGVILVCRDANNLSIEQFAKDHNVVLNVRDVFPENFAEIYRNAISNSGIQKQYFQWHEKNKILTHAILDLGEVGNLLDIPLLKPFTDTEIGESAIKAIARIEGRFQR